MGTGGRKEKSLRVEQCTIGLQWLPQAAISLHGLLVSMFISDDPRGTHCFRIASYHTLTPHTPRGFLSIAGDQAETVGEARHPGSGSQQGSGGSYRS